MINLLKTFSYFLIYLGITSFIFSQSTASTQNAIDNIFFDSSVSSLEQSIKYAARKQAVYSYNIANATTVGFEPILFPEDQLEILQLTGGNAEYFSKVLIEHMATNMARNRSKYTAYHALYKKKFEIYRNIASGGKK